MYQDNSANLRDKQEADQQKIDKLKQKREITQRNMEISSETAPVYHTNPEARFLSSQFV